MGASRAEPSARVLGRYVLHGELASGGMATVHLGRLLGEAGFARTVAIKRLHPQFAKDPDFVAMFVDEARLAARIRHPNVVPTLDVIAGDEGELFLVMEYVAGESLSRLLRALQTTKKTVPPHIATTIIAGVLHGLHAAHEAISEKGIPLEIVHRDVSPQNVLVGTDGIAHVLDFGVAKAAGRVGTTRDGQIKGKISYMAPEQLGDGALTRQSDVYAAAVVLWEALTLKRLFEGNNEAAVLVKVIEGRIPLPSELVPSMPSGIDEVVLKGLARDPSQRWATAREFALALEGCAPVARPSEIGEWVQSIAGDELARRAKMVAEIERGSIRIPASTSEGQVAPLELPPGDSVSGIRVGEMPSQVSTISVSKSEYADAPRRQARSGRLHFVAGGLLGIAVVVLLLAFTRSGARVSVGAAPASPPTATAIAPAVTAIATAPPIESAAPAAPSTGDPIVKRAPAPAPAATAKDDRPRSPPAPPKARARADCDPPFTRDAQGHKHYKLQCL